MQNEFVRWDAEIQLALYALSIWLIDSFKQISKTWGAFQGLDQNSLYRADSEKINYTKRDMLPCLDENFNHLD